MQTLKLDFEKIEVLNIIGLNGHRFLNQPLDQLELIRNDYINGILRYRRVIEDRNSYLYINNFRVLLRVVVKVHHPEIIRQSNQESKSGDACHLLIFENWLGNPSETLADFTKSEEEYLGLSTLRFWKLVDVDGFFGGNSFYRKASNIEIK